MVRVEMMIVEMVIVEMVIVEMIIVEMVIVEMVIVEIIIVQMVIVEMVIVEMAAGCSSAVKVFNCRLRGHRFESHPVVLDKSVLNAHNQLHENYEWLTKCLWVELVLRQSVQ